MGGLQNRPRCLLASCLNHVNQTQQQNHFYIGSYTGSLIHTPMREFLGFVMDLHRLKGAHQYQAFSNLPKDNNVPRAANSCRSLDPHKEKRSKELVLIITHFLIIDLHDQIKSKCRFSWGLSEVSRGNTLSNLLQKLGAKWNLRI